MSGQLKIRQAQTKARLIGAPKDAAGVERQLHAMLAGPVAQRLGQIADRLPHGEVICLPSLKLRLHLTLADLQSSAAADLWAAQIETAIEASLSGNTAAPPHQHFASRRAYHAAYIRHRLGLHPAVQGIFTGFTALDLLSPARAMAAMMANEPTLWVELGAKGAVHCMDLLRAVQAQGGDEVLRMILAENSTADQPNAGLQHVPQSARFSATTDLREVLSLLNTVLSAWPWASKLNWQAMSFHARWMLATLALGPLPAGIHPVPAGATLACLIDLVCQNNPLTTSNQLLLALSQLAITQPHWSAQTKTLIKVLQHDKSITIQLLTLLPRIADLFNAQHPQPAAARDNSHATNAKANIRHFSSAFAGVALVLPHLAEDGIGKAFAAKDITAALADLLRCDLFPQPEDSEFLHSLSGRILRQDPPDRPNTRDLLFIPKSRHGSVLQADAGAPRLAAWLTGRFAATLPGLAGSSLGFLQRHFFHISGELWIDQKQISLRLDPMPLRAVLELAGRIGPDLARLDWLSAQSLTIGINEG